MYLSGRFGLFFFLITFGVQNGDALRDESFMILPVWHSVCSLNLKIEVSLQLRESAYSGMTLIIFSPTGSVSLLLENY